MDPTAECEELAAVLREMHEQLRVLTDSHEALAEQLTRPDGDRIVELNAAMQAANERLATLDTQRQALLAGSAEPDMNAMISCCDLSAQWSDIETMVRSLADPMRRNQQVIGRISERLGEQLALLRGEDAAQAATYSASGGGQGPVPTSSRHLGDA
ncbi:MAG: flagellar export chaperone FlgN [Halothiobacillaceae bacterium]